jgi:hypothetical protein
MGTVALEFSSKPKTRHRALVIGTYVSPSASGFKAKVHMWRAIERGKTQPAMIHHALLIQLAATISSRH